MHLIFKKVPKVKGPKGIPKVKGEEKKMPRMEYIKKILTKVSKVTDLH